MSLGQAGVGPPHDCLELEELLEERRLLVVDLLGVEGHYYAICQRKLRAGPISAQGSLH